MLTPWAEMLQLSPSQLLVDAYRGLGAKIRSQLLERI